MLNNNNNAASGDDDGAKYEIKQVELNTIAASFAGLSTRVANLHRQLVGRFGPDVAEFLDVNRQAVVPGSTTGQVPINPALEKLPLAFHTAHKQYKQRFNDDNGAGDKKKDIVVLMVVQEGETNTVDQRMLEFALWENHAIPVVRMSLTKLFHNARVDQETGALLVKTDNDDDDNDATTEVEVSIVYFRAGYAPTDYPDGYNDGKEWLARERIENSRATKCPTLGYHLAGTKKVQQELARPGTLERFFSGNDEVESVGGMRGAFAGLYSLAQADATKEDMDAVRDVLNGNFGSYVLKPQREGGGYNFYGQDLLEKVRKNIIHSNNDDGGGGDFTLGEELAELILMQRLFPPQQKAILLRGGQVEGTGDTISELGCFGGILVAADGTVLHNEFCGFLLRTKFSNVDEGGVASGFATLSSPYLCE